MWSLTSSDSRSNSQEEEESISDWCATRNYSTHEVKAILEYVQSKINSRHIDLLQDDIVNPTTHNEFLENFLTREVFQKKVGVALSEEIDLDDDILHKRLVKTQNELNEVINPRFSLDYPLEQLLPQLLKMAITRWAIIDETGHNHLNAMQHAFDWYIQIAFSSGLKTLSHDEISGILETTNLSQTGPFYQFIPNSITHLYSSGNIEQAELLFNIVSYLKKCASHSINEAINPQSIAAIFAQMLYQTFKLNLPWDKAKVEQCLAHSIRLALNNPMFDKPFNQQYFNQRVLVTSNHNDLIDELSIADEFKYTLCPLRYAPEPLQTVTQLDMTDEIDADEVRCTAIYKAITIVASILLFEGKETAVRHHNLLQALHTDNWIDQEGVHLLLLDAFAHHASDEELDMSFIETLMDELRSSAVKPFDYKFDQIGYRDVFSSDRQMQMIIDLQLRLKSQTSLAASYKLQLDKNLAKVNRLLEELSLTKTQLEQSHRFQNLLERNLQRDNFSQEPLESEPVAIARSKSKSLTSLHRQMSRNGLRRSRTKSEAPLAEFDPQSLLSKQMSEDKSPESSPETAKKNRSPLSIRRWRK